MKKAERLSWFLVLCLTTGWLSLFAAPQHEKRFRRPVALAWTGDGHLAVANRDAGSISLLDVGKHAVASETPVGKRITSLAALPGGHHLLATDEETHQLNLLRPQGANLRLLAQARAPHSPVNIKVSPDGAFATVTSLWSRRVSLFRVDLSVDVPSLRREYVADLPFPPRRQWINPAGDKLVVADAFADRLAILSLPTLRLLATRTLPGHNVGGLALSPNGTDLLVSHQILNPLAPTTRSRIFWGTVMRNVVTGLELSDLLDLTRPPAAPIARWKRYPVGAQNHGAGEPGSMLTARNGAFLLGIRGTGEVAVSPVLNGEWKRIPIGKRPVDALLGPKENFAYFADVYGDAVRVIDLRDSPVLVSSISLGPTPKPGLLQRGEVLFHDSHLSLDGWFSCNSCHTGGHTSGRLNDNFDDHSFGTPKRVPSLLGTAETGPWTWNGLQGSLTTQVRQTLATTLLNGERKHGRVSREDEEALVSFLFTLPIPPPLTEAREEPPNPDFTRGKLLFGKLGCNDCHRNTLLTSPDEYDVGLSDEAGARLFNPPTLLGVSQRDRFFHDGSAHSLRQVLDQAGHPDGGGLTQTQLNRLLAYLRAL